MKKKTRVDQAKLSQLNSNGIKQKHAWSELCQAQASFPAEH